MAGRPFISAIFLILALVMGINVLAQTPSGSMGCTNSLNSLSPCFGFLTGGSATTVAPACCSAFATVASGTSSCLCLLFGTNTPLGFPINPTQVFALPGLCNVNNRPLTQCPAAGVPLGPTAGAGVPVNPPVATPPASSPTGVLPSPGPSPTGVLPSPGPSPTENPSPTGNPPATGVGVPTADSPSDPSAGSNPGEPTTGGTTPSSNGRPITNVGSGADALFTPSAVHLVAVLLTCLCM